MSRRDAGAVTPTGPATRYVVRTRGGYYVGYRAQGGGVYAPAFGSAADARRMKQRRDADSLARMLNGKVEEVTS